jgi:hypothetical protein
MIKKTFLLSILVLFSVSSLAEGVNWLIYFESERGSKSYIDMDSIKQTSHYTTRVLKKVEPGNPSEISSLVSEAVIDCKNNRIKYLKETAYLNNGETEIRPKNDRFQKVTAEDIDESLLELVCSLKKSK